MEEVQEKSQYRELSQEEQDMLLAQYDKHNGKATNMILDQEVLFKGTGQLYYYIDKYGFKTKLAEIRKKRAEEVIESLHDSKIEAIRRAQQLLGVHYQILRTKKGVEIYDADGKPIVVEVLPFYKEIKAAWEIIKIELGEPTTISKGDITSNGKEILQNAISLVPFNAESAPNS